MILTLPDKWRWFPAARFGLFIHWGPYAQYGRGEQVLFREHLDQPGYVDRACAWNPQHFDARLWAATARDAGMRYAVLTARHHDGYCLWDSRVTNYASAAQAPERDFVGEYVEAFREAGLRVGLYYSLADWRIPAYWEGPEHDPAGWDRFRDYVHTQVRELLSNYGRIDVIWFDGAWPHHAGTWRSRELVESIRALQPDILINNRLGTPDPDEGARQSADGGLGAGESRTLGDFGTPEHHITAESGRLWESCQVSTWRLWGYTIGERWRPADYLLDMLIEAAQKGGNLLLNVGPEADGGLPPEFVLRARQIGRWLQQHGEAVYDAEPGEVCEFITYGRQLRRGNHLYLVIRFWDRSGEVHVGGLETRVERAVLLSTGAEVPFEQSADHVVIKGLPQDPPAELFPVLRLDFGSPPEPRDWARDRLWCGDPRRMTPWAAARGSSVWADGVERGG
ncbi:MAG: alpha-L-fucosidase [Armatimonadetes bacterium]|nr:alpha-L-fucosidase [Armatimonadota bacterium]